MSGESELYDIDIKTPASPAEVSDFCTLLEDNGYAVTTDLAHGKLRIKEGEDDE